MQVASHSVASATVDDGEVFGIERRLKPVWFDEADILANLEREYRPGE